MLLPTTTTTATGTTTTTTTTTNNNNNNNIDNTNTSANTSTHPDRPKPAEPGMWLTCSSLGKCGRKDLRPWETAPTTLATQVEKDFSSLPGIPDDVYEPVRKYWESSPPAFRGAPVLLEDLASFTTDLLRSDPFQTGDDVPVLDFNSAREGGAVAISQRQLAFLVANAVMGNRIDKEDGLTLMLARCSDSGFSEWIYSLLSLLAVLSRELRSGEHGRLLVAATPRTLLEGDDWRGKLQNSTLGEPALCVREGNATGCDLADFMAGNPGQALTDIAGGVVGGGAALCSTADSQDESLVQFYPEVLAFSFFVDPNASADKMGMLPVPWTLLGARRYMGDITGQRVDAASAISHGNCGRIREKDWLNEDIVQETEEVVVAGKTAELYSSAFVAVQSVCSSCRSGQDCNWHDNLNNFCDSQRRHLDEDLSKWYQAFEQYAYPEEVQQAFSKVVKRIGTGPWGAGVWGGDSQQYFLAVWLATSLLSSGTLDYYMYSNFCENPGNQCFVLGGDECKQCVADSGVSDLDAERCGSQSVYAIVDMFKNQPAQDLYDALSGVGGPPDQVFDAVGR
ncbi:unnamed protein product [Prorocentrum cordatum]|uniref:Poly(ADP-ribose) glycohydrolase n=1 Tax=Prorocentrum cordatum TaxID=2364126 RepID=A0ABN9V7I8_9DINO|nr:unnamed protein product [Polarella glacialis]